MRAIPCTLSALVALAFLASLASAAPPNRWRADGNALTSVAGIQAQSAGTADGADGAIFLWRDERRGGGLADFYAQRISSSSALASGWPANGALIAPASAGESAFLVPDGANGALVVTNYFGDIRGQHLLANGTTDPAGGAEGFSIVSGAGGPSGYFCLPLADGGGGAYILYNTFDFATERLLVTRVDASGAALPGWSPGVEAGQAGFNGHFVRVAFAAPPAGGVVVGQTVQVEVEPSGSQFFSQARKLGAGGGVSWTMSLGSTQVTALAPDATDGAIVRFGDGSGNHFDGAGQLTWAPGVTLSPLLVPDGVGGVFHVSLTSPGPAQVTVRRVDADGALPTGWSAAGVTLASAFEANAGFSVQPSASGVMLAWTESGSGDIRATVVTRGGGYATGHDGAGRLLCRFRGTQSQPAVVPLAGDRGIVAWTDTRRDAGDIFANLAAPSGGNGAVAALPPADEATAFRQPVGPLSRFDGGQPGARFVYSVASAGRASTSARYSIPRAGRVQISVLDVQGRRVAQLVDEMKASGTHVVAWDGRDASGADCGPGVYFLRLGFERDVTVRKAIRLE